jgi:heme/copper-type cytochrome/quinol oxidase subunit 3
VTSRAAIDVSLLPDSSVDTRALIWWGQALMLVIEGTVLGLLVATYFYLRFWLPVWPPAGTDPPPGLWPALNLLVLVLSAVPMRYADKAAEHGDRRGALLGMLGGLVLIVVFLAGRAAIWKSLPFTYSSHAYGSIVFTVLGAHTMHVIAVILETTVLVAIALDPDRFHAEQRLGVVTGGMYWNFVVGSWIVLFALLYLAPRVL